MSSSIPDPIPDGITVAAARHIANYWKIEAQTNHDRWIMAMNENEVLKRKLDWLMMADKLIVWDGKEWKIRREILPK